jgi:hypothetical protein
VKEFLYYLGGGGYKGKFCIREYLSFFEGDFIMIQKYCSSKFSKIFENKAFNLKEEK